MKKLKKLVHRTHIAMARVCRRHSKSVSVLASLGLAVEMWVILGSTAQPVVYENLNREVIQVTDADGHYLGTVRPQGRYERVIVPNKPDHILGRGF